MLSLPLESNLSSVFFDFKIIVSIDDDAYMVELSGAKVNMHV